MKRLALLLPLLAFAAAGCFQEETIFVPFVDPATNAPALMPEPLSALRLGMTESELRAVRPDARPGNDELVPGFFEELREGAFQHAVYLVEDTPGGGALAAVMLVGEPPEGKTSADAFAAVLREAESRLGPAPRRFEVFRWGAAIDVHAWEHGKERAFCSADVRSLNPDADIGSHGGLLFAVVHRDLLEKFPALRGDLVEAVLAALDRPASEDARPVAWVDPLPGTNRIETYVLGGVKGLPKAAGDAVLALVSDYGSFDFSVEPEVFSAGNAKKEGFAEIAFSGPDVDVDDPRAVHVAHDGSKLRVDNADGLLFTVPEDRRAALRNAVAAVLAEAKAPEAAAERPSSVPAPERARVLWTIARCERLTRTGDPEGARAGVSNELARLRAASGSPLLAKFEPVLLNNHAWALHLLGRDAEALSDARRSVELEGDYYNRDTLACILAAQGRTDEAKSLLSGEIARLESERVAGLSDASRSERARAYRFHLAKCLARAGDAAGAKALLDPLRAAGFVPDPPEDADYDALAETLGAAPLPDGARERAGAEGIVFETVEALSIYELRVRAVGPTTWKDYALGLRLACDDLSFPRAALAPENVRNALDGFRKALADFAGFLDTTDPSPTTAEQQAEVVRRWEELRGKVLRARDEIVRAATAAGADASSLRKFQLFE